MTDELVESWRRSRSGSHAGRGFRFQDVVATHLAVQAWAQTLPIQTVTPEGLDDISLRLVSGEVHVQVKSRRSGQGDFSVRDVIGYLAHAWESISSMRPPSRARGWHSSSNATSTICPPPTGILPLPNVPNSTLLFTQG